MFPKRVHVKWSLPAQQCWFPPYLMSTGAVVWQLALHVFQVVIWEWAKKHHEVLFPSNDSLLKIYCDKIILDELLIQSLQNTLWSGEGVHAKNSAPAKRNGTMCSWQRQGVGRNQNPPTSAQPQLPLPPPKSNQDNLSLGFVKTIQIAHSGCWAICSTKPVSLPCFPHTLKIPLKIWTNVWMRPVPPPQPLI